VSALALEEVTLALGRQPVLRGVDLRLEAGEVLVLAGRNGAGKSTLLRVAAGLMVPEAGRVALGERPLATLSRRAVARRVALVPQDTSIPFPFRTGELVLMGRAPHLGWLGFESAEDRRIARESMQRLGILALADRSILELSGGERQLVLVARALAQQPDVLLLDEPTAHLDLARRLEVLALVRERARRGKSALVVTHDLGLAARAGDRLALLSGRRILACGPPSAVLTEEHLRRAFGVLAQLVPSPVGPVVVATAPADDSPGDAR